MDETSIKTAWAHAIAKLPVRPEEIQTLVTNVLHELANAASKDGEPRFDEETSSIKLPNGLTLQWDEEHDPSTGLKKCEFAAIIAGTKTTRTGVFLAQVAPDQPPTISDYPDPKGLRTWTDEDGPQKAWITHNLRSQVMEFIARNQV